jgi:hypothetical protein
MNNMSGLSWLKSTCKECDYPVVVTQGKKWDYRWYCSNLECIHHECVDDLGDMEWPDWVNDTTMIVKTNRSDGMIQVNYIHEEE